jgi:tRNA(Ile)-lysidine synthase TilS/MesJ
MCCGTAITGSDLEQEYKGNLIPVGGGKDSFVTLHILEPYKQGELCLHHQQYHQCSQCRSCGWI